MAMKPIPGAPVGAQIPVFPGQVVPAPVRLVEPITPVAPAKVTHWAAIWTSRYFNIQFAANPLDGWDTLFQFQKRTGTNDFSILLTADRANFIKMLRNSTLERWNEPGLAERWRGSNGLIPSGLMLLHGDPKFRYWLRSRFSFGLVAGPNEHAYGITLKLEREEPPASGRKNPTSHEIMGMQIGRDDLVRLFDTLGIEP